MEAFFSFSYIYYIWILWKSQFSFWSPARESNPQTPNFKSGPYASSGTGRFLSRFLYKNRDKIWWLDGGSNSESSAWGADVLTNSTTESFGPNSKTRTCDNMLPKHVLFQLSYIRICGAYCWFRSNLSPCSSGRRYHQISLIGIFTSSFILYL